MQQLNIFDFYAAEEKKASPNQLQKVSPEPVKRRASSQEKAGSRDINRQEREIFQRK